MLLELVFIALVLIHSSAAALGVGSSTIAIAGFLTAIADGEMDASERRMMGVVYLSLRIAMVLILLSTLLIIWMDPGFFGAFTWPQFVIIAILYGNAILMTKHWIPMKIGPAVQAGTWYTLGFLIPIYVFDLAPLTPALSYGFLIVDLILAVIIVNACLRYLAHTRTTQETP